MSNTVMQFLASIVLTIGVISAALFYLRRITNQVLIELCHTEVGAKFWLRSADVVALSGGLMLVMLFGNFTETSSWLNSLRVTLAISLIALMVTVIWVGVSVNGAIARQSLVKNGGELPAPIN
jgi:hypothetical protein